MHLMTFIEIAKPTWLAYARRVKVFNTDFVEANIGRLNEPLPHILILLEENKEIAAELKVAMATRDERRHRLGKLGLAVAKAETSKG